MLVAPNQNKLTTMKNLKRIILLAALVFLASKVLFSDFEITTAENNATVAIVTE